MALWRNMNAAVCKTAMSRGSTGRGLQDEQNAKTDVFFSDLLQALVAQRIRAAGFYPAGREFESLRGRQ